MSYLFMVLLFLTAVLLILLVLIQRGKGGGLAGAFGGLGGQSAFGTKAGDTFTRITIGVAATWILLRILGVRLLATKEDRLQLGGEPPPAQDGFAATPSSAGEAPPVEDSGASDEEATAPAADGDTPADTSDDGGP